MPNIRLLGSRVLVKPALKDTKTDSGVYIPESMSGKLHEGTVIAIGDSRLLTTRMGDSVIFLPHSGVPYEEKGEKHFMLHESDILAII